MLNNKLSHILSADAHFDLVGDVVRVPRQEFALGWTSSSLNRR